MFRFPMPGLLRLLVVALGMLAGVGEEAGVWASELWVGGATVDITPDGPAALSGQRHVRIAHKIESRLTATALAVETRDGRKGTVVDAYGLYADKEMGEFMKAVEMHKRVHDVHVY